MAKERVRKKRTAILADEVAGYIRVVFGLLLLLPWVAPVTVASAESLNALAIRKLMSGATIETKIPRTGASLFITFKPDGVLSGRIEAGTSVIYDEGKWWTGRNQLLCRQWQHLLKARKLCSFIVKTRDRIVRWRGKDGTLVTGADWTIREPGPETAQVASAASVPSVQPVPWAGQDGPSRPVGRPPASMPTAIAAQDTAPPSIELPATLVASGAVVEIEGRVRDASRVVEVTVDSVPVPLGADGTLSVRRGVPQGQSTVTVAAVDEWGNRTSRQIKVSRPVVMGRPPAAPQISVPPTGSVPVQALPLGEVDFGRYHALVVGNNKYRRLTPLKTAVNDARAVAKLLADDYGFQVELLIDATRSDLIGALSSMRAKLTPEDNLLIYYAGHGELDEVAQQGYWLPVDAAADVPTNWVSTSDITVMVRVIRAKHIMVVADSCYSGTLVRDADIHIKTARQRIEWLKRMAQKRARTALVSGGLEPVLDSGGGGHSVFAKAFIDALRENRGVMDGETLFDTIKRPVVVNSDQTPQYADIRRAGHDGGDFLFVRR